MVRFAAFTASAALALLGVANAIPTFSLEKATVREISPEDLLVTFRRDFVQGGQQCPQRIAHTNAEEEGDLFTVPHSDITQDDQDCTNPGRMLIGTNSNFQQFQSRLASNPNAEEIVSALANTKATPLFGVQPTPRICGNTRLAANTLLVFFREEFDVVIGPGLTLPARQRFMLLMQPNDRDPCVYIAPPAAALPGGPVNSNNGNVDDDSSESTASPAGAQTVVPVPVVPVVPEPMPTASPSAAPAPSVPAPAPVVPAVPVDTEPTESGGVVLAPIIPVAGGGDGEEAATPEEDSTIDGVGGISGAGGEEESVSPSAEDDGDDGVCFPADATVELKDGSVRRMEQVVLNDKILVSDNDHSDVFMFTHRMKDVMHQFVNLTTADGSLTATAGHYVYVNNKLTAMRSVKTGDSLIRRDGSSSEVFKVETVLARGLFNPQTLHGDIYVNGFKASTYTTTVEPTFAHALLSPFRALHLMGFNPLAHAFDKGSSLLARFAPRGAAAY